MIWELKKQEFYKCRNLLYDQGQIEAKAVIEGINPGRVFVDDSISPTSGLIWLGNNDGFIFIGDDNNSGFNSELNDYIDTVIRPAAKKVGLDYFEGIGNHPKWNKTIKKLFKNCSVGSWEQRVYTLNSEDYRSTKELDLKEGYVLVEISRAFLKGHDIKNIAFLQSKILDCWSSEESFLNSGIGFCVVYENEIVSVCLSSFVVEHVHCIDIETLEIHRGKKLAQNLAHAFVKECLEKEYTPYCDCMVSNKPSVAIAENIGFKITFDYTGYEFSFGS